MQTLAKFLYYKILGWKTVGTFPDIPKCVIIIVPHTSWVDFFLGLLIRSVVDRDIKYLAKQSLFKPPVGWLLRATGGTPIDRTKSGNTVKIIKEIFDAKDEFRLALSPEGTRKAVSQWKSGFYFIARAAKAPIVLVAFDYGRKEIKFSPPQHPSGNLEEDIRKYKNFFEGVGGKVRRKSPLGKRQKIEKLPANSYLKKNHLMQKNDPFPTKDVVNH